MQVDVEELQKSRAHLDALKRRKKMREDNGLIFYEPHPKQDAFHRAGRFRGRYARTGNRFGKSQMGVAEDCAWLLGERIWYPKDSSERYDGIPEHPVKGLVVCQDWDKATEIFTSLQQGDRRGKFFQFLPKAAIVGRPHRNHSGHVDQITVKSKWGGESVIHFDTVKSFKVNPLGAESSDWDFIHVDEPIPEDFWQAISRGLIDRGGKYWFTCTPLCEMWINDHFIPPHLIRSQFEKPLVNDTRWTMTGSMRDNPYLKEVNIREFEKDLTPEERACRIEGIPTALSGMVYKAYDPMRHIFGQDTPENKPPKGWDSWLEPPRTYTFRVAIDPHPKTPHAVLFAATSPHEQTFFYHEIFSQVHIADLCEQITTVLDGRTPHTIICDPYAWIDNPINGYTMADEFYRCNVPIQKATKELAYGILKTQEALKKDDFLYFHDNLRETKHEFDHYVWAEGKDKPVDKNDHMMENLYRLVLDGLTFIEYGDDPKLPPPTDFRNVSMRTPSRKDMMRGFSSAKNKKSYSTHASRYPS